MQKPKQKEVKANGTVDTKSMESNERIEEDSKARVYIMHIDHSPPPYPQTDNLIKIIA